MELTGLETTFLCVGALLIAFAVVSAILRTLDGGWGGRVDEDSGAYVDYDEEDEQEQQEEEDV